MTENKITARPKDSIANQKVFLEDYTRRSGFTNIQHYTDDGVSGTTFIREDF